MLSVATQSKRGAVERMAASLESYSSNVMFIAETRLKTKYTNDTLAADGYFVFG